MSGSSLPINYELRRLSPVFFVVNNQIALNHNVKGFFVPDSIVSDVREC